MVAEVSARQSWAEARVSTATSVPPLTSRYTVSPCTTACDDDSGSGSPTRRTERAEAS